MDSFFDKLSRKLAMSMSRRDSLLLMMGTAATGLLAACGNKNSCSNGEVGCGSGCCSPTQTCCNGGCASGICCGSGYCSYGSPVCCYYSNCTYCCAEGQTCGGCSGGCQNPDGTVHEALPLSRAKHPHMSL